jgi:hypothetical protein
MPKIIVYIYLEGTAAKEPTVQKNSKETWDLEEGQSMIEDKNEQGVEIKKSIGELTSITTEFPLPLPPLCTELQPPKV